MVFIALITTLSTASALAIQAQGPEGADILNSPVKDVTTIQQIFINIIGHYNPLTAPETVVINEEEALKWLKQGAQPTATAARLLSKAGIMEKFKTVKEKT
jgi:ribosomal protein S16